MPEMINVRLIRGDDWCGLYINGKNVYEGHNISIEDFVNIMESKHPKRTIDNIDYQETYCDFDWLEEFGGFPSSLSDVVFG